MESVKLLNRRLAKTYGSDISGRPMFRLVWSETEMEKRRGTVNVFYGNIFVRTETGVHSLQKYPYIQERWILERLVYMPNPELVESDKGHYECVYVFQDKDGNYLAPIWMALEYACRMLTTARGPKKNGAILAGEDQAAEDLEAKQFNDYLNQEQPAFAGALRDGEAVSMANLDGKGN